MIPSVLSLLFFTAAWLMLLRRVLARRTQDTPLFMVVLAAGLLANGWGIYQQINIATGYEFSFFKVAPLFFAAANLLIFISGLRNPMHNLFLFSLPLSFLATLVSLAAKTETGSVIQLTPGLFTHVLFSIVAYSLMTIALLQALLLNYQNQQIRSKHPGGFVRLLPPLQTMESLLFELLWAGEILLTLAIASGALFVDNMLAQHLAQKTVFSVLAWVIYALLLWGRHAQGWRGPVAMRWTLTGFVFLVLAYFGTKLVLELILNRV